MSAFLECKEVGSNRRNLIAADDICRVIELEENISQLNLKKEIIILIDYPNFDQIKRLLNW